MKHRLYTTPTFFEGEAALLNQLFALGLPCLHLRKPLASKEACSTLLKQIKPAFYPRIIVHQEAELVDEFGLGGRHLTETARRALTLYELEKLLEQAQQNNQQVGTAIHMPQDLAVLPKAFNYVTLSPIFPSISKKGYLPFINWEIEQLPFDFNWVALGGIQASNLEEVQRRGFEEVAFLGAVWKDYSKTIENYQLLCKKIKELDLMD